MKKTIFLIFALITVAQAQAQVIEVYDNDKLIKTYISTETEPYKVTMTKDQLEGHDFVTIGGLKWATMNVGATSVANDTITAYGKYYAWGEIDTYSDSIDWKGYIIFKNAEKAHFPGYKSKYYWDDYSGANDFKEWSPAPFGDDNTLLPEYDVAHTEWGGTWRMPTESDFLSLINACGGGSIKSASATITAGGLYWVSHGSIVDGVTYNINGILCVATADISHRIFLPAQGRLTITTRRDTDYRTEGIYLNHGYYWTSSKTRLCANYEALWFWFGNSKIASQTATRVNGVNIRPVSN